MIPLTRSLNIKLLLIVVCVVALAGVMAALRQERVESQRLQVIHDQRMQRLATSYQRRVAEELQERKQLLLAAHALLTRRLFGTPPAPAVPPTFELHRDDDQGWRLRDGSSAVFVHKDEEITPEILFYAYHSQSVWEQMVPLLGTSFSAIYFISDDRMTRIWPAEIVANHRPDHDVTSEIFFTIATPANNPKREARWTPIYFESYASAWMISLIIPIYDREKFIGVIGADLDASFLLGKLSNLNAKDDDIKGFIFDDNGRVILHTDQQSFLTSGTNVSARLDDQADEVNDNVSNYIRQMAKGEVAPGVVGYREINQVQHRLSYYPLADMNWYLGLYYSQSVIDKQLKTTLLDIYTNILLFTLFLSVILFYSLNYFVIRRIRALALATASVSLQNWKLKVPEEGRDEISFLARCINVMLAKINNLIEGLNANIAKLETVNLEAKKLTTAIEHSTSMVVILNKEWVMEYANAQFWRISGYSGSDRLHGEQALLFEQNVTEKPPLDEILSVLYMAHRENPTQHNDWRAEYLATRKDGSSFWLMQTISAIFSETGELEYFIAVGHDSTDVKQNQQKMEQLAYFDHLTGLHNRVLFKDQLRSALHACQRDKSHFALMYLDLDHFKRINDTLGHEAGDALLIEVAARIKQCLREDDIVARLGGDEFAIMLHQVGSAQYAYVVANKVIAALNQPLVLSGQEVVVGVSIGITLAPDDSQHVDALMKNADLAMYQAKEKGRNTFQFYTADMNAQVEQRLALESDLRQALKNQEFELYYQPIIDLRSGKIVSAEALLRWHHPSRGLVSPQDFIPVAEDSGLIVPIGKWVVRTACQQAKNIQKSLHRPLKIAVNVSARQLHDNGFVAALKAALEDIRLAPEWLSVELTETTLMADGDMAIERLERIRTMGVSIAIDDFGTGYSSLSHLKRLPVNTLKIDRSFVEGLPEDEEDRAITTLIVAMANSLNYKVVVEGVETAAQLTFLTLCGCDYAQGFYFNRPVPADELMQILFAQAEAECAEGTDKN